MNDFSMKFINKSLQVCIMFLPILVWDIYFLFQCFLPFPYKTYDIVTILCIMLLLITILFGNSFIRIKYTFFEEIEITFRKPNGIILLKNIYYGIPIIICLFVYAGIPFYIYGMIQFIYMVFDKKHYTLTERIYRTMADYYKRKLLYKDKRKETLLA